MELYPPDAHLNKYGNGKETSIKCFLTIYHHVITLSVFNKCSDGVHLVGKVIKQTFTLHFGQITCYFLLLYFQCDYIKDCGRSALMMLRSRSVAVRLLLPSTNGIYKTHTEQHEMIQYRAPLNDGLIYLVGVNEIIASVRSSHRNLRTLQSK